MNNIAKITTETFNDTIAYNPLVIIDYYGEWCSPCKAYSPTFERVAKDYIGRAVFGKINVDEFQLLDKHDVRTVPVTVVVKNGQVVEKIAGNLAEEHLRLIVAKYI